jgi:hypothetical protein
VKSGICPKCSATTVYGARDKFRWGGNPKVETSRVVGPSGVDTYICTACGYFENYLADPGKLAEVAQAWSKVEPQ